MARLVLALTFLVIVLISVLLIIFLLSVSVEECRSLGNGSRWTHRSGLLPAGRSVLLLHENFPRSIARKAAAWTRDHVVNLKVWPCRTMAHQSYLNSSVCLPLRLSCMVLSRTCATCFSDLELEPARWRTPNGPTQRLYSAPVRKRGKRPVCTSWSILEALREEFTQRTYSSEFPTWRLRCCLSTLDATVLLSPSRRGCQHIESLTSLDRPVDALTPKAVHSLRTNGGAGPVGHVCQARDTAAHSGAGLRKVLNRLSLEPTTPNPKPEALNYKR